jgi:hypothetical protein
MFQFGISENGDDMLKEASGKRPGPAGIEERFWKID